MLWCPRSWGQMWSGGWGGDPCLLPRDVSPPAQVHRHTHATHACAQLPNTRSTAHKLPSHAPGAGVCTRRHHPGLWGPHAVPASWGFLPAGRQAPRRGAACAKVPATQRNKGTGSAGGGSIQGRGWGKWAREPLGLGSRQGDGPRPRCWVMRAWESRGWPRSGADALEGPGLAGTLGAKSRVKRSRPVPKSRRSSGQGEQLHPAQGLSTRRTPARPALEVPGP